MTRLHEDLLREFQDFAPTAPAAKSLMERISQRLHEKVTKYNWVGFYLVDRQTPGSCQVVVVDDVRTDRVTCRDPRW